MCKFESSEVSQPVPPSENRSPVRGERPANGRLLQFGGGLLTPDFGKSEPNLPKVSGRYREYSRFWETDAGDWVRSSLRPAGGSRITQFLCFGLEEIGNFGVGLPCGRSSEGRGRALPGGVSTRSPGTAAPNWQCNSPDFPPWPSANRECRARTGGRVYIAERRTRIAELP
jgi:hypothetical protein